MRTPLVSVVMPAYNEGKYIKESIDSILNQTFTDFELIIINDCSTDNTAKIVNSYNDNRIIFIDSKANQGFPDSRNTGLKIARGKYIALLDADDVSEPRRLEMQVNYLGYHQDVFLVGGSAIYIDGDGKVIGKFRKYNDSEMLAWRLPKSCSIVSSSIMYRNDGRLYKTGYGGACDYKFYLDLLTERKRMTNLPNFLVKYRLHSESMSNYNKIKQEEFRDKALSECDYKPKFKLRFIPKLLIHYLKTYREKRGK